MAEIQTPYSKTDKVIKYLSNRFTKLFSRVFSFDELNVIEVSHELYDESYTLVKQEAARLAKQIYRDNRPKASEEEKNRFDALAFVLALALAYNPVTKYVFENELDRKRARFVEGILSSDTPAEERALAKRLLIRMTTQFLDDITFDAMVQAYRDNGTKEVRWVTHPDDRRCKHCKAMHGKIYPISKIPPKPHINCRCWVEEVTP